MDHFHITFSDTEDVAMQLKHGGEQLHHVSDHIRSTHNHLLSTGLQGSFLDHLDRRLDEINRRMRYITDESLEAGQDLQRTVNLARELDRACALKFQDLPPGFSRIGSGTSPRPSYQVRVALPHYPGAGFSGEWSQSAPAIYRLPEVNMKDYPYHLREGLHIRGHGTYATGDMTVEEIIKLWNEDPLATKWTDYVHGSVNIWGQKESASIAAAEGYVTGNFGTVYGKLFNLESEAEVSLGIDEDGLKLESDIGVSGDIARLEGVTKIAGTDVYAGVSSIRSELKSGSSLSYGADGLKSELDFEAGVYALKGEVGTEVAGFDIAAEGYVGANVKGSTTATIAPITGEVGIGAEAEYFYGGRVEGQVSGNIGEVLGNEYLDSVNVGVQGGLSYGVGAKFDADIGVTDSVFRADVDIGATLGLGGEFGFTVELDMKEAVNDVVDFTDSLANINEWFKG